MWILIARVLTLVLISASWAVPQTYNPRHWTPELMTRFANIDDAQASPDGSRVAYVLTVPVRGFTPHIFVAKSDGSGTLQLTSGGDADAAPRWSPDGKWIAFLSSRSGKSDICLIKASGGKARRITHVKNGVSSFKWSYQGKEIAFTSPDVPSDDNDKAGRGPEMWVVDEDVVRQHLWIVSIQGEANNVFAVRRLTSGPFTVSLNWDGLYNWSPDGKSIVFTHTFTPTEEGLPKTDLSVVGVGDGAIRSLVHTAAAEIRPVYSPDGRWIAYEASEVPFTWRF